ncbi:hypothetical protein A2818_01445 [Candidatus Nomurabacteria bacterium RIFCSPHIGHO2_01_FULL_40_12]|uniref:Uncharacterized protein n=1 Tax=Candidatus Nomurabacteria bacterium RIFCSPHIGHO2_01_FULL_40_12 TaxID=1801737 RepID=A0A1F6V113_9BACT|nr:MAG: hypothetical protein A2818_01445 [Candidatus Nomurabacteria bacterium RIFCSPHIGHO2_01_FULL_40_12]
MSLILIPFFISLIGIVIMIGRKLALVQNGKIIEKEYIHPFVPDFQKMKYVILESLEKYGHLSLVAILRSYIKITNFVKYQYEEIKIKIQNRRKEKILNGEIKETSKFLKMISDYKHKIRKIKHSIHEEEKNL